MACAAGLWIAPAWADSDADTLRALLALERQGMDGWKNGDPNPQLAVLDPKIIYISALGQRLDGLAAVKELFAGYRGTPLFESYEILNPKVRTIGDTAILTYQLAQHARSDTRYWNGTQVYLKTADGWRVVHSHWSPANDRQQ